MPASDTSSKRTAPINAYAVLIGVDDYSTYDVSMGNAAGATNLAGSRNDVRAWWRMCRDHGFPAENILVLTSPPLDPRDLGPGATKGTIGPGGLSGNVFEAKSQMILDALQWLSDKLDAPAAPVGLLTFSGHGAMKQNGKFYLCPSDMTGQNLDLALSFNKLRNVYFQNSRMNLTTILDCCFAGACIEGASTTDNIAVRKSLQEQVAAVGDCVYCAAPAAQTARQGCFGGEMRGALSWALSTVIEQTSVYHWSRYIALTRTNDEIVRRAGELLTTLGFKQKPVLLATDETSKTRVFTRGRVENGFKGYITWPEGENIQIDGGDRPLESLYTIRCYTINEGSGTDKTVYGKILITGAHPPKGFTANKEYWKVVTAAPTKTPLEFTHTTTYLGGTDPNGNNSAELNDYKEFSGMTPFSAAAMTTWNNLGTDSNLGYLYIGTSSGEGSTTHYVRFNLAYSTLDSTWSGWVRWYSGGNANVTPHSTFNTATLVQNMSYVAETTPGT